MLYSSRRQSDKYVEHVQKHGQRQTISFAQKCDPCIGIFGKFMSSWRPAKTRHVISAIENVGVIVQLDVPVLHSSNRTNDRKNKPTIWLGTDNNQLRELDFETLNPLDIHLQDEFHPSLDGMTSTAHAMRWPQTGDYINVNIKGGPTAKYRVFRVSAKTGEIDILAEISRADVPMAYLHSFFMSEHFVVLRVPSSHLRGSGLGVLWEKNFLDAIVPFDDSKKCKWFVVDRIHSHGVVDELETEAGFFFHTVNCFEETRGTETGEANLTQTDVTCDVVEYPTMDIIHALSYDTLLDREGAAQAAWGDEAKASNTLPRLVRWKFTVKRPTTPAPSHGGPEAYSKWIPNFMPRNPVALKIARCYFPTPAPSRVEKVQAIRTPHAGELPTINNAYLTRPHRYVYSMSMRGLSTLNDGIVKTDVELGEVLRWNNHHGHTPGEAVFVARPGAEDEDDGVLLNVVLDGNSEKSYLLCLDVKTMVELSRAEMEFAVGVGFRGLHVANNE